VVGCLRKVGCLVSILALAAGAYLAYLNGWIKIGPSSGRATAGSADTAVLTSGDWEPLTPDGATRARTAIESLGRRSGPVYSTLTAGDLASYIFSQIGRQLPPSAEDVRAAVRNGRLYVRATVRLSELGGDQILGPLAGLLGEREEMQFGGTLHVLRPGLAEFKVEEIRLREFRVPRAVIPRLIAQLRRGSVPEGVSPDALPLEIPRYIADVRVNQGKITLYKAVP
jgi:hypothetical protein